MKTRLLPVLALALASTVGCSSAPPTLTTNQPQADTQRQIAQADDMDAEDAQETQAVADYESRMPAPLSVQALPQRLDPSQVVELPEDKLKELNVQNVETEDDRSIQQRRSGIRGGGSWRGGRSYGSYGWRGRGLRYYSYGGYYYPYYLYSGYYYPYAYYPYTYAYYPYSYYDYGYYPYYTPFYSYGSYYYPYRYGYYGRYGRYGGRGWRGGRGRR